MESPRKNSQTTDDDEFVRITIKPLRTKNQLVYNFKKKDLNEVMNDSEETILHLAVGYKDTEAVQKLIDLGSDVDARNKYGASPLLVTLIGGYEAVSEKLIDTLCQANANIVTTDHDGRSPLSLVLDHTRFIEMSIVKILLQKFQSDCENNNELIAEKLIEAKCPLARAICLNNAQVTKLLIESGVAVDTTNSRMEHTALHTAVSLMDLPNVKLLVDHGANIVAKDAHGLVPLAYCKRSPNETEQAEIVRILTRKREHMMVETLYGEMQIGRLLSRDTAHVIRALLENDLDLRARDCLRNTPLHFLATNRNPNIVEQLEGKDIDVHAQDHNGNTPLFYAIRKRNISMMEFLLKSGANVHAVDISGNTPLMDFINEVYYSFATDIDDLTVVKLLLEHGASVQHVQRNGITVFDSPGIITHFQKESFIQVIMGHLILREELGQPISEQIHQKIIAQPAFKKQMDLDRAMIEQLKNTKFTSTLSAYTVLVENVDQLVNRIVRCGSKTLLTIQNYHENLQKALPIYLIELLCKRLDVIINRVALIYEASEVMGKLMGLHYTSNYLIIREIISYLDYVDMKNLIELGIE